MEATDLLTRFDDPSFRDAQLYALTTNPLLLTAICLVHRSHKGALPGSRGALLQECTSVLLEGWRARGKNLPVALPATDAQKVLQPVALWLHGKDGRTRAMAGELEVPVREGLSRVGSALTPDQLLRRIRDESGLLTGWGNERYGFMHLGFQEYLAALELRWQWATGEAQERAAVLEALTKQFGQTWWREVMLLALGSDDGELLERFMAHVAARPGMEQWAGSALMGRLLGQLDDEVVMRLDGLLLEHELPSVRAWWRKHRGLESLEHEIILAPRGGVKLVRIPGGRLWMGSPEDEEDRYANEGPQHEVELAEFYLAPTPVTNAQYGEYLRANPGVKEPEYWGDQEYNQPNQPVVGVSWEEAQAYCEWAGLTLPTEAQWEYACRARTTTRYHSGDSEADLQRVGWYDENSDGRLHPVGELEPNGFGLYDMHGNVGEWCQDDWVSNYNGAVHRPGDGLRTQPVGNAFRVFRGGVFDDPARVARSACRFDFGPDFRVFGLSFRPAQVILSTL